MSTKVSFKKLVLVILANLLLITLVVVLIEVFLRARENQESRPRSEVKYDPDIYILDDPDFGYILNPGKEIHAIRSKPEEVIYDVTYTIDSYGKRVTPQNHSLDKKKFVAFVGGSNTFGEGLNDDETLPAYFAQSNAESSIYNFAVPGYGPQHIFTLSNTERINDEIKEEEGLFVYQYFRFHNYRMIGDMFHLHWMGHFHYYKLDGNNQLVRGESFIKDFPISTKVLKFLANSRILKRIKVSDSSSFSNSTFNLLCKLMKDTHMNFLRQKPRSHMVVLFAGIKSKEEKQLEICLKGTSIYYLNLVRESGRPFKGQTKIHPIEDSHFNGRTNQWIAEELNSILVKKDLL
jgi:hypothetical protein